MDVMTIAFAGYFQLFVTLAPPVHDHKICALLEVGGGNVCGRQRFTATALSHWPSTWDVCSTNTSSRIRM